ncbi:MAG: class I SAM-dependent methyltransferase [Polyangiaceae bacterium]
MIHSSTQQDVASVASHYDELDPIYRQIWGEHVHHGLWSSGHETPEEAVEALSDAVGDRLDLAPGLKVVDIGCGYGATARRFAERRNVDVVGVSVSAAQVERAALSKRDHVTIVQKDWLDNGFASQSFDRAYSIESSEHMVDKPRFFSEAQRVLVPSGRLVVCAWLAETAASRWKVDHLLEPICREGRLPSMGTREDYERMAREAGFDVLRYDDLSLQVARTWTLCAKRLVGKLFTDTTYLRLLASASTKNRIFALSLPRLMAAYRTGAMRYGIFVFRKP